MHTMEYYAVVKRRLLPFAIAGMDLKIISQSEISQSEKDRCPFKILMQEIE